MAAPFDPEGLSTVQEVPVRTSYEAKSSLENGTASMTRHSDSKNASVTSSFARSYNESVALDPPPVPATVSHSRAHHARRVSGDGKLKKADRRKTVAMELPSPAVGDKALKRGGLRNTIRRIFGRKSVGSRISMPTGTAYQHSDPQDFITVAAGTHEPVRKVERSASLPTNAFVRSSGLSSHPPSMPPSKPAPVDIASETSSHHEEIGQSQKDHTSEEIPLETIELAVPLSSSNLPEDGPATAKENIDSRNIGFAVTNGSNPRRRSRSVGEFRGADHRMSPIQWHHLHTKSDEQLYFRGSREIFTSRDAISPNNQKPVQVDPGPSSPGAGFNFGLQDEMIGETERIGLEERLMTLEIKLMDLEYSLSRIRAGSLSISQRDSKYTHERQASADTNQSSGARSGLTDHTPLYPIPARFSVTNRPTSVATTLKAGQSNQHNSFWRPTGEAEQRVSLSALTIEHYTTLVTLIRREQAARMRLEEQVSQMQGQLEKAQTFERSTNYYHSPRSTHGRDLSSSSHLSRQLGMLNTDGRRGGMYVYDSRTRGSSYSTNETDTEDDYHDAYVTHTSIGSTERGEYERGAFNKIPGVEDGEAF